VPTTISLAKDRSQSKIALRFGRDDAGDISTMNFHVPPGLIRDNPNQQLHVLCPRSSGHSRDRLINQNTDHRKSEVREKREDAPRPKALLSQCSCLISCVISFRAAASVAAPAAASSTTAALWWSAFAFVGRRRPYKRIVDVDCLVEQFGSVEGFDGFRCLGEGRIFNQCVTLVEKLQCQQLPWRWEQTT
jgi:hypothetical protein